MITIPLLIQLLTSHGFPAKDIPMLTCIATKESSLNSKAINHTGNRNGTKDHGLFQINDVNLKLCAVTRQQLLNVHTNIKCAKKVYETQNLKAWVTYKTCKAEIRA